MSWNDQVPGNAVEKDEHCPPPHNVSEIIRFSPRERRGKDYFLPARKTVILFP